MTCSVEEVCLEDSGDAGCELYGSTCGVTLDTLAHVPQVLVATLYHLPAYSRQALASRGPRQAMQFGAWTGA